MTMEEKNNYIERYIAELAKEINSRYNTDVVDEEKISRVLAMYKNSEKDLEKEIILEINELAKKVIEDYEKYLRYLEEVMKKKQEEPLEEIATLDLETENNGLYLSQQQIDLLMITDIKTKEDLKRFIEECAQFPNMGDMDIKELLDKDLEEAKETLYKKYQDSLADYLESDTISNQDKAKAKLQKLGIDGSELEECIQKVKEGHVSEVYETLGNKYGTGFITSLNRFMFDDFENVKDVSYAEMKSLSDLIKRDDSIDTIIVATGKFENVMYRGSSGMVFDPYLINRGAKFCAENNLHMRYHALFDQAHLESSIQKYIDLNGRSIENLTPEEITKLHEHKDAMIAGFKEYIRNSIANINNINAKYPGLIKQVEVFNELVEKNKKDKNSSYDMVWKKYFGIEVKDIMDCFKDENGNYMKPDGVEYMYNETTLTESPNKRAMVEKVLHQIEQEKPGFIDTIGDQMHLSNEDVMTEKGRQNLRETAQMLSRFQAGKVRVDGEEKTIQPKKTECTEHDYHFTEEFLSNVNKAKKAGLNIDLWKIKKQHQDIIGQMYRDNNVKFERSTYWSIFGQNDHNVVRANKAINKENKKQDPNKQRKPLLKSMGAGLMPDGKKFDSVKSLKTNKFHFSKEAERQKLLKERENAEQLKIQQMNYNQQNTNKLQQQNNMVLKRVKNIPNKPNTGFVNIVLLAITTGVVITMIIVLMNFLFR